MNILQKINEMRDDLEDELEQLKYTIPSLERDKKMKEIEDKLYYIQFGRERSPLPRVCPDHT